jgi:hypothetical protein
VVKIFANSKECSVFCNKNSKSGVPEYRLAFYRFPSEKLVFGNKIFLFFRMHWHKNGGYYLCFSTSAIEHRHHPLALLLAGLVGKVHQSFF